MKNVKKSISFILFFLCLFSVFSIQVNGENKSADYVPRSGENVTVAKMVKGN